MIERSADMDGAAPHYLRDIPNIQSLVLPLPAEPGCVVELRVFRPLMIQIALGVPGNPLICLYGPPAEPLRDPVCAPLRLTRCNPSFVAPDRGASSKSRLNTWIGPYCSLQ